MAHTFKLDEPIEGHTHCLLLTPEEAGYIAFLVAKSGSAASLHEMPATLWRTGRLAQFALYKYKWSAGSTPVVELA